MGLHHSLWHIYDSIHTFISPSRFLADKVKAMSFKGRVVCIPNSINVSDYEPKFSFSSKNIVFFGRLAEGKGLLTLIKAFEKVTGCLLKIIGDGPLRGDVERFVRENNISNVVFLGYKSGRELLDIVREAMFVVVPSEWYENYPLSVVEAFALGKPVIGSNIGGITELVKDGFTGCVFEPWNKDDLLYKINALVNDPVSVFNMGMNARSFAENELNSDKYYERLMRVYQQAINEI
jgi:glycosyltransferase involved in cell wall biosynthesis